MKLLLDTANLEEVRRGLLYYPIAGVTTNPTILKKEEMPFEELIRELLKMLGNKELHIQVTADCAADMLREADAVYEKFMSGIYMKVPADEEGLLAMKMMKRRDILVTATAVYSTSQAYLAGLAGADYAAPYFNRMQNLGIESGKVIREISELYDRMDPKPTILAASFKNVRQVMESVLAGADAVTVSYDVLKGMAGNAVIEKAAADFKGDWREKNGGKRIDELI